MGIQVERIQKHFGRFHALDDISLDLPTGQLSALLGPSGSGKTTLLRIIAGLEHPDSGQVRLDGEDVSLRHASQRGVGFVFQQYALFRHMTVFENVAFGLKVLPRRQRPRRAALRQRVMSLLELVQLEWTADRYPSQLSGGQRQRIALARALATHPRVLLLDEPFGALDARVRAELRQWLRRLHEEIHVSTVFVTHDQEEALEVADRLVVMNHGRIEQVGHADRVYQHPATPFVCEFMGEATQLAGYLEGGRSRVGSVSLPPPAGAAPDGAQVRVYVRPHEWEISRARPADDAWQGHLQSLDFVGPDARLTIALPGQPEVEVVLDRQQVVALGLEGAETLWLRPHASRAFVIPGAEDAQPTAPESRARVAA